MSIHFPIVTHTISIVFQKALRPFWQRKTIRSIHAHCKPGQPCGQIAVCHIQHHVFKRLCHRLACRPKYQPVAICHLRLHSRIVDHDIVFHLSKRSPHQGLIVVVQRIICLCLRNAFTCHSQIRFFEKCISPADKQAINQMLFSFYRLRDIIPCKAVMCAPCKGNPIETGTEHLPLPLHCIKQTEGTLRRRKAHLFERNHLPVSILPII